MKMEGRPGEEPTASGATSPDAIRIELEQRLAAVETTLQALQKSLETKPSDQKPPAAAPDASSSSKDAS